LIHLREWRTWRALTQKELAESAGVAVNTVSRLELHLFGARPDVRRKLAKALGIEPHQLLTVPPGYAPIARDEDQAAPEPVVKDE
jgi:transcriptional regulator with XRE-family HTH domain